MVSVTDGKFTSTRLWKHEGGQHVISLHHNTFTGFRSAMCNNNMIVGSEGYSSLLMENEGHRICFTVADLPGYIEIKKSGWKGFSYNCVINNNKVPESTEPINNDLSQDPLFTTGIQETVLTPDEKSHYPVTWYVVKTTRIKDDVVTTVHRLVTNFSLFYRSSSPS
jgi:hypothetical protein